jgi:hypothetical protein
VVDANDVENSKNFIELGEKDLDGQVDIKLDLFLGIYDSTHK